MSEGGGEDCGRHSNLDPQTLIHIYNFHQQFQSKSNYDEKMKRSYVSALHVYFVAISALDLQRQEKN